MASGPPAAKRSLRRWRCPEWGAASVNREGCSTAGAAASSLKPRSFSPPAMAAPDLGLCGGNIGRLVEPAGRVGEHLAARRRHADRVLELGRELAIARH